MSDDEQVRFSWGMPGPTDPLERARATQLTWGFDPIGLEQGIEWNDDGIVQPSGVDGPTGLWARLRGE